MLLFPKRSVSHVHTESGVFEKEDICEKYEFSDLKRFSCVNERLEHRGQFVLQYIHTSVNRTSGDNAIGADK